MSATIPTTECRLLIFEGIMGSGKSTATRRFGETLAAAGSQVTAYTEAADPHPVRASPVMTKKKKKKKLAILRDTSNR